MGPVAHISSYYAATARDTRGFAKLEGDLEVDVAIIGGGFTGVATALELAERGVRVALCEAHKIGWGASGRNGGQITGSLSGDAAMEREFSRQIGHRAADYVWNLRWRGHDIIKSRVETYRIDCDLAFGHMQTALKPSHMTELQGTYEHGLKRGMGEDLRMVSGPEMSEYLATDIYLGGLLNKRNMHLHSLDLCVGEARAAEGHGALIFEASEVSRIDPGKRQRLVMKTGSILAEKVLIAGNAYHLLEQAKLSGKLFPASLANMATTSLDPDVARRMNPHNIAVYDSRFVLDYYRMTADNRLMFGGGTNYSGRASHDIAAELRPSLERTFPQLKGVDIEFCWSGLDGIILNRIPQVARPRPNTYVVQGYSGHGIGLSHILAEITANAILGDDTEFSIFENARHWSLPVGRSIGSLMVALGMAYYRTKDRLRR